MLNPFLMDVPSQVPVQIKAEQTKRLQAALASQQPFVALHALSQGADPHATDAKGHLLLAHALECHHPRLVAAFFAVGGRYTLRHRNDRWAIQSSTGQVSHFYAPSDPGFEQVIQRYKEFEPAAAHMRATHDQTTLNFPNRRVAGNFQDPICRHHALLSMVENLRRLINGSQPGKLEAALNRHPIA